MQIGYWAEFIDSRLENEFFNYDVARVLRYFRIVLLVLGICNLLFIIPDFFNISNRQDLLLILVNKTIILLLVVFFYFAVITIKDYKIAAYVVTCYMLIFAASYLHIVSLYPHPNYLIKCFDIIIIIMAFFLIPNRWCFTVLASIFLAAVYFVYAYYRIISDVWQFAAGVIYIVLVIIISAIASYRTQQAKRQHYVAIRDLKKSAATDPLTGLYNRNQLYTEIDVCISQYNRIGRDFALVLFDIDHFKQINDQYGHLTGDRILVELSALTERHIRTGDLLARWGGEEFVLLLPGSDKTNAVKVAQDLRDLIKAYDFQIDGALTCSFGVISAADGSTAEFLINKADEYMYRAKKQGRDTIVFQSRGTLKKH